MAIDKGRALFSIFMAIAGLYWLMKMPIRTGRVDITKIPMTNRKTGKSIDVEVCENHEKDMPTINGMVRTPASDEMAVREMDNAVSPLAMWVNRFEVIPPGLAAKIITPMASIGSMGKKYNNEKARMGRRSNWQNNPMPIDKGCFATRVKSFQLKVKPIANIMKARPAGKRSFVMSMIYPSFKPTAPTAYNRENANCSFAVWTSNIFRSKPLLACQNL